MVLQVKHRTGADPFYGSHVMQFGDIDLGLNLLYAYMGTKPANENYTFSVGNSLKSMSSYAVNQRDADLIHFWTKVSFLNSQKLST